MSRVRQFTPNARKFLAFQFFLALNTGIYGVIFNLYVMALGYHEDFLGLLLAIIYISTGIFSLPAAMLCDRIGRKRMLMFSSLVLAFSLGLLYTLTSGWALIAGSILFGMATACSTVASSPFMAENSSRDDRIHLFSINAAIGMASAIIGSLAGGLLPGFVSWAMGVETDNLLSYRLTLYLSLAAVLMTLLPILSIREKDPPAIDRNERFRLVARVIRTPTVRRLVLVNVLVGIGAGMIVPFFNVYFHKVLSASEGQIGVIFAIGQVVMVLGLLCIPRITGRFGKVRTIALTELLSIPFLILIAFTMNIYLAGFAYVMRMTLMNMANPAIQSFSMEIVAERERATVSSLNSMGWNVFLALSTFASGIMMSQANYLLPYMITCIVYFIAAVAYYVFFLRIERKTLMQTTIA
jgi:MFS family permease